MKARDITRLYGDDLAGARRRSERDLPCGVRRTIQGSGLRLHAFKKKATSGIATPQRELDLIRQRLQLARKLAGK